MQPIDIKAIKISRVNLDCNEIVGVVIGYGYVVQVRLVGLVFSSIVLRAPPLEPQAPADYRRRKSDPFLARHLP